MLVPTRALFHAAPNAILGGGKYGYGFVGGKNEDCEDEGGGGIGGSVKDDSGSRIGGGPILRGGGGGTKNGIGNGRGRVDVVEQWRGGGGAGIEILGDALGDSSTIFFNEAT